MEFNRNYSRRMEILGIKDDYKGGIEYFENLTINKFKMLLDEGFIDPKDCQNESPSAYDFYNFMFKYPELNAHGYAVSPERDDYRVTIEGLAGAKTDDAKLKSDFIEFCKSASSLKTENKLYSWWD